MEFAAGVTAAVFTTLAIIAILWGAAHVVVGVPLRRHRPWARLIALMLGSVDLLLLPYGTALGVYALWALLERGGKALFDCESQIADADCDCDAASQSRSYGPSRVPEPSTVRSARSGAALSRRP